MWSLPFSALLSALEGEFLRAFTFTWLLVNPAIMKRQQATGGDRRERLADCFLFMAFLLGGGGGSGCRP